MNLKLSNTKKPTYSQNRKQQQQKITGMSKEVELRKTHTALCICDQLINSLIAKPRYHCENLQQPYFKSRFGEQIPGPNKSPYF